MTQAPFVAWFELPDGIGIDHAGNAEPIREVAITLNLPQTSPAGIQMSGSQVCSIKPADKLTDDLLVRIIPDTRMIETSSMLAASALLALGYTQLDDKPSAAKIKAAKSETAAHLQAVEQRAKAVLTGDEHPADVNDPNPAPVPAAGHAMASFHINAADRLKIDQGIEAGEIPDDEDFAKWLAETPTAEVLGAVGEDRILATRALVEEQSRGDGRKGLLEALHKIATKTEAFT